MQKIHVFLLEKQGLQKNKGYRKTRVTEKQGLQKNKGYRKTRVTVVRPTFLFIHCSFATMKEERLGEEHGAKPPTHMLHLSGFRSHNFCRY